MYFLRLKPIWHAKLISLKLSYVWNRFNWQEWRGACLVQRLEVHKKMWQVGGGELSRGWNDVPMEWQLKELLRNLHQTKISMLDGAALVFSGITLRSCHITNTMIYESKSESMGLHWEYFWRIPPNKIFTLDKYAIIWSAKINPIVCNGMINLTASNG